MEKINKILAAKEGMFITAIAVEALKWYGHLILAVLLTFVFMYLFFRLLARSWQTAEQIDLL